MPSRINTYLERVCKIIKRSSGILLPALLTACAVSPGNQNPSAPSTITINTIPAGADISIQDNYVGTSPLTVAAPPGFRSAEPWRIEARLPGHEVKHVRLGTYQPPVDQVLTRVVESYSMIYTAPVGTKTIPAYYILPNRIDIKLYPLPGYTVDKNQPNASSAPAAVSSTPPRAASPTPGGFAQPTSSYQAKRTYSNGDIYVGEFQAGQLNGKGVYQFKNGDRYEGQFRNNLIDGNGTYFCVNGKTIPGPFNKLQPIGLVMNCN